MEYVNNMLIYIHMKMYVGKNRKFNVRLKSLSSCFEHEKISTRKEDEIFIFIMKVREFDKIGINKGHSCKNRLQIY